MFDLQPGPLPQHSPGFAAALAEGQGSELQLMMAPGKTNSKSKGKIEGDRMKKIGHLLEGDLQIELAASQRKQDDDKGRGRMIIPHEGGDQVVTATELFMK